MKFELLGLSAFLFVLPPHFAPQGPLAIDGGKSLDPGVQEEAAQILTESAWLDEVSADIERGEYFFSIAGQGAWSAPNRSQGLRSRIDAEGIAVLPRESLAGDEDAAWELSLSTRAFGREEQMAPVGVPTLEVLEERIELHHSPSAEWPSFTEWYVNDERGIEQGWTIPSPPPGALGSGLRIELEASGLQARIAADGLSARFVDDAAETKLRYHGLKAWDTTGLELPARLVRMAGGLAVHVDDEQALYPIIVDPVLSGPVWTVESDRVEARLGSSVSGAGDVNGDGFDDVILGTPTFDSGKMVRGRTFLYLGSASGLSLTPDWTVAGDQVGSFFGNSVSGAGDVNGDGFDDVIVGARLYDNGQPFEGRALVYLGSASGLSLTPGWTAESDQVGAWFGHSVYGAGDVNGDGFDDLIIGAPQFNNGEAYEGRAFLYLGSASGPSLVPDWTVESDQIHGRLGSSVSGVGDVNGDGFDDVIVGADSFDNGETNEGGAFLYLGSAGGPSLAPDWMAEGGQALASFGFSVSGAGDVNGDGFDDMIVGAPGFENGELNEGRALVYLGSASGPSLAPNWTVEGNHAPAFFGWSVSGAGDVNSDGFDDMIIGASHFSNGETGEGRVFLYLGSANGPTLAANWTAEGNQALALFGISISGAGDVNVDGFDDVIIGAPGFDNGETDEGRVFLYLGQAPQDCNGNGIDDSLDITSGSSADHDGDSIPDECTGPGTNYCFGDGSSTACPCANPGGLGEGCTNSGGQGAALLSSGTASVGADDLGLHAYHLPPGQPALLCAGSTAVNGGNGIVFGDGLRCAGGTVLRLGVTVPNASGQTNWGPGLIAGTGWAAGGTQNFQGWYRDPSGSPCGSGFNLTNGVSVVLVP